ncbi:MAG: SulP family inorganic anion transporter [Alphaproteobacteria bacterium]|nr:SulP family inorganic anion transporter [Alphaproteobacteria bacterium]
MRLIHGLHFDNIRGDIYGGLTAAVVALPLALAFGVASGAGPIAGLYGAIFVGLFAALFGGTPAQVSGPTGPMTVVMAGVFTQFGHEPAMAFTVVMLAGLLQILFGVLKLGRYINLMPFPVISGFMSGIGIIIIILQLAPLVGHTSPVGGILIALVHVSQAYSSPAIEATAIGLLALFIVFAWPARLGRIVPPPLVALVIGTLVAIFALPGAPVLGEIPTGLPQPILPLFDLASVPLMLRSALILAVLGTIDSLLTSLIADNVTQSHHNSDRELIGQGIGNAIAGVFGAIPGAGATMRTVVNVRAGGRTPISGALHALVLLVIVLGLGGFAERIPHAVLAGILIKVGLDIIDWGYLQRVRRAPGAGVVIMLVVLLLTVFVDLITAVGAGVVLASLLFVKRMSDLQLGNIHTIVSPEDSATLDADETKIMAAADGRIAIYHLSGPFSFGAANGMARRMADADAYDALIVDLSDVPFLDSSASLAVEAVIKQVQSRDKQVFVAGVGAETGRVLDNLGALSLLSPDHRHDTRREALHAAARALGV